MIPSNSKSLFYFITVLFMVLTGYSIYNYMEYQRERSAESVRVGEKVKLEIAEEIDSILVDIKKKASSFANKLENQQYTKLELLDLISGESFSMNQILGITVAYEPFKFNDSINLFAPYYDKSRSEFIYIEKVYDYTDSTLATSKWYTTVRDGGARWVEPYYAEGAETMVSDFGVPFYRLDPAGNRTLAGTVTYTISLQSFTKLLHRISLGKTGYGFVTSARGNYIAHPISEYVSRKNILEVAAKNKDAVLEKVGKAMLQNSSGFVEFKDQISKQDSYLFYTSIPSAQWNLAIVFIKSELLGNPIEGKKKLMHIAFASSLLFIALLFSIFGLFSSEKKKMWIGTAVIAITFLANIIFIWYLTLYFAYTTGSTDKAVLITNNTALSSFVNKENNRAQQMKTAPPVLIPTGVFIREIEFADSYNVNVSGTVWQKYHMLIPPDIKRGISFPQTSPFAEALYLSNKRSDLLKDYELVTWDFRATLRINFDYSTYPFDFRQLSIELSHPEIQKNIMLTPDLVSYKIINPSSKPGVNKTLVMPESEMTSSFFNYKMKQFNTNFGNANIQDKEKFPALHFNVILKRQFINAFVSNIIPILIVALMVFFLVYSSGKSTAIKRSGVSSLGVVESSAAFFFVLILAHIDLRKTVNTSVITYMEYFYFIMYLILALVVFNIVLFTRNDNYLFFDYKDNLIVKLTYWPIFMALCFLITLLKFY